MEGGGDDASRRRHQAATSGAESASSKSSRARSAAKRNHHHPNIRKADTMGADIYLESIFNPFAETLSRRPKPEPDVDPEKLIAGIYDAMRASGGYFRNGYNSGDVMWAMGLSWHGTVVPMLDDNGYLPVGCARELVSMIEARPLTRESVAAHLFANMTDGVEPHPLTGQLMQSMEEAMADATGQTLPWKTPPDFDHLFQVLNTRRGELLTILRKAIDLNEPLLCDL
jgi:hypothetical protein